MQPPDLTAVHPPDLTAPCNGGPDVCLERRFFVLIYDPTLESQGGKRLTEYKGWNDVDTLLAGFIADISQASHGAVTYKEAGRLLVDGYMKKEDGYQYTDDTFLACLSNTSTCHKPNQADGFGYAIDYPDMLAKHQICDAFNRGEYTELWVFGAPYMGMWEANQAGVGAFSTNGPVVQNTSCNGILNIFGFSYERGVAEMLENMGHRIEGTMRHVYENAPDSTWTTFIRYDKSHPGNAHCGNVHYAPNSDQDYDWGNPKTVTTYCDDWLTYPSFNNVSKQVTCSEWGCDARQHKVWWLSHLPHVAGTAPDGKRANWWYYVVQ